MGCQYRDVDPELHMHLPGICRSTRWVEVYDEEDGPKNSDVKFRVSSLDWPWDCETGDYATRPIDVRAYEKATKELAEMNNLVYSARRETFDAFNGDVTLVALAFMLMLCVGALMYWKCARSKGDAEDLMPLIDDRISDLM